MRTFTKILIVRFSSLGDIILASPLIRILRAAYPHAQIDFLVKSEYADILKPNPHLSSVIELKTAERDELRTLKRQLRANRYDLILDLHNNLRSRYVRLFSRTRRVRVVRKRAIARFFLVKRKWNFYRDDTSVADRYLETVKSFGLRNDGKGLEVFVPEEVTASASAIVSKCQLGRYTRILGMVPTARHYTKRWPQERFVEFGIQYAKAQRSKVLLFGSKDEVEYCGDIAQMVNAELGSPAVESLAGKLTLLETAAVFDRCDVVVTNDTGLMHLAAARKRKIVAVFGSTVRELGFFPYGTESIVVEKQGLSCRPCTHIGLRECPRKHFLCMKGIEAQQVLAATETLLGSE
ncbi:MAG: lipopolysaccharide heptosyltransferase II [Ignavibacteria bacterium]|nr:lipopolysaccharide heptosyltransferase II [Ignavibacteria bacterium]